MASVVAFTVCVGFMVYANRHHPSLDATNWHQKAPVLIAMATIFALTGIIRSVRAKHLRLD